MIRTSLVSMVMVMAMTGCDRAADEQRKADEARATADEKTAEVRAEADEKIAKANQQAAEKIDRVRADADLKVNEAQASFLKLREEYRHDTTQNLVELDKKIADLEAKAKKETGKRKAELNANLPAIRSQRDAFVADYKSVELASATTWDETKARLDKSLTELKQAVDRID